MLFIVPYPINTAPSQRLKFEQYFGYFEDNGVEITFSSFVTPSFRKILYENGFIIRKIYYTIWGYLNRVKDIIRARNFDIIYLHLEAAPFGPPIFEYILSLMNKPIIYDIDDVVYLPHVSKANKFIIFLKSPSKISKIMELSSHIIVVTRYLKQYAERYNKNVTLIPSTVDTDKYFIKNGNVNRKVCIGWTGSHSTSGYLLLLENVLKRVSEEYDVRIKVIGDRRFRIDGLNIDAKDWSSDTEVEDIQDIDIGVYPLPKNEWVMGKGGLKAIQYMGVGIPVVCTRIGEVVHFVEDGVNGFLADSDEEWIEKISKLIRDSDLRKKMGFAARKTVEDKFSVKVNAYKYIDIFTKIMSMSKNL